MATMVCMPAVSANAKDAVLVEWRVKEGDAVRAGDSLGGIETDKAVVDLEAEHDGVIGALLVEAGSRVEVGAPVAVLLREGETAADVAALREDTTAWRGASTPGSQGTRATESANGHVENALATESADGRVQGVPATTPAHNHVPGPHASGPADGRVFASPLARRVAAQAGLALRDLRGSGPQGRIVKRDVERATSVCAPDASDYDVLPHTAMRLAIARRLTESKTTIPHFYLRGHCRADALLALRIQLNAVAPRKISINDMVVRGAACALRDVPEMNVAWTADAMHRYRHTDISVAVATDGGLITPVVRGADQLSLTAINAAMAALVERAHGGRLGPADYEGGTFGISNLGMHGVTDFAAIINPPQAAMLAVGAIAQEPVVDEGTVRVAALMRYTLAVDHRAIDGTLAARWMTRFTWYMEHPVALLA